jgi:ATP-dependent 26S proteasome regulatory subunit
MTRFSGWTDVGDDTYRAAVDTVPTLPPGLYDTIVTNAGLFFSRSDESDRDILRFPDAPIDTVVAEIERFWDRHDLFRAHGMPHKRGILLYGPPGSGKTCTIQLIARDVIERGGVVFTYSDAFANAYHQLRSVEEDRPLVVLMEDLDSIITPHNESRILNVLDGIGEMTRVVFVASTNYPEKLGPRITNRPSRFDRKVLVGHPGPDSRRMYLDSLKLEVDDFDIDQWVKDTDGFSLAHLKELFVSVLILGNEYTVALKELAAMREAVKSYDFETHGGYRGGQYA